MCVCVYDGLRVLASVLLEVLPHWGCPSWSSWAGPSDVVCAEWDSGAAAHIPAPPEAPANTWHHQYPYTTPHTHINPKITISGPQKRKRSCWVLFNPHSRCLVLKKLIWPVSVKLIIFTLERRLDWWRARTPNRIPNVAFLTSFWKTREKRS